MLPINMHFDEEFFKEEIQNGFYIDRARKELWAVELDLLNEFDIVCRKYKLKYFLDGGSLLGAIRHKGFIPWDDDIDLNMLREDYEKFVEIAKDEFGGDFFFQDHTTESNFTRGFCRVRNSKTAAVKICDLKDGIDWYNQGIYISIFPLDFLPEKDGEIDKVMLEKQRKQLHKLQIEMHRISPTRHRHAFQNVLAGIRYKIAKAFGRKFEEVYADFEALAKSNPPSAFVDELAFLYDNKMRLLRKEWYDEVIYVPFAGLQCPVPKEYDKILEKYYGKDYMTPMQLPTMHGGMVFDVLKTYLQVYEDYRNGKMKV